ncbi:RING/U-box superfamily protein [Forsythia ovata]|uniref:RING/U-box superfamily protein n=1 Tax=Forsythia ovata TaxID=205694 RepID=A0ABD1R6Q5_9LAMI
MKRWFCCIFSWVSTESGLLFVLIKKIATALFTCIFALGGATIGAVTGGIKGQTTETGLLRGIGVGTVAGAITAVQLMELIVSGEPFSKVALICSLVDGKIFMEWVSPAVLKAYQWQISNMETSLMEISDIFDVNATRGLSQDIIKKLPNYTFYSTERNTLSQETNCAICLQDFRDGECAKMLPSCGHSFHLHCIDDWLIRQGNCPLCRNEV